MLQLRFINTKRERKTITLQTQNASKPDGRSTPGTDGRRRAFATFSFLLNGKWTDFPIHLLMLKKTKLFISKTAQMNGNYFAAGAAVLKQSRVTSAGVRNA